MKLGNWNFTPLVDSWWAGIVQIKWNTKTGVSLHSSGHPEMSADMKSSWGPILQNMAWLPIHEPDQGWDEIDETDVETRFEIYPHVAFGPNDTDETKQHAIFLLDTFTGTSYVLSRKRDMKRYMPSHDDFSNCQWYRIDEPEDHKPQVGRDRYILSVASSNKHKSHIPTHEFTELGYFVTRLDKETGDTSVLIAKWLLDNSGHSDVAHIWHQIPDYS